MSLLSICVLYHTLFILGLYWFLITLYFISDLHVAVVHLRFVPHGVHFGPVLVCLRQEKGNARIGQRIFGEESQTGGDPTRNRRHLRQSLSINAKRYYVRPSVHPSVRPLILFILVLMHHVNDHLVSCNTSWIGISLSIAFSLDWSYFR